MTGDDCGRGSDDDVCLVADRLSLSTTTPCPHTFHQLRTHQLRRRNEGLAIEPKCSTAQLLCLPAVAPSILFRHLLFFAPESVTRTLVQLSLAHGGAKRDAPFNHSCSRTNRSLAVMKCFVLSSFIFPKVSLENERNNF